MHLGTPCSSFSIIINSDPFTKLRSRFFPLGLPDLSPYKREKAELGNALVQEERGREDLALWTQWEVPAVYTVEAEDDGPRLFMAEIHRKDDREGPISPGAHLTLVGTFVNLPRGIPNLTVRIWITDQENVIASEVTSSNISTPHGMVIMHCHMQINAPLGHYDLCCAMWCGAEARPFEPVWSFPLELIRR